MKKIFIGILGFGNVGQGVMQILLENSQYISEKCECEIIVKKILVSSINKKRNFDVKKDLLTENIDDIINDEEIDIVIELMGGVSPAKKYIIDSLNKGKHVISANKMCIAENVKEIIETAEKNNVMFKFEASVAGGIPIINGINTSLTANKIESIIGIVNGTTNYILSKMSKDNCSIENALEEAQLLGFAESDPTSDVENFDAMYKLKILAKLAFGFEAAEIHREGIKSIRQSDIEYAKEFGYVIKSLAIGKVVNEKLELRVHPTMIKMDHPLANINDSFNALLVKGNVVGELMFYGRGAGGLPTGSAVVSDMIFIISSIKSKTIVKNNIVNRNLLPLNYDEFESKFYVRLRVYDVPGVLSEITGCLARNDISVLYIIQKESCKSDAINLVILTHQTTFGQMDKFLNIIKENVHVQSIRNVFKVE